MNIRYPIYEGVYRILTFLVPFQMFRQYRIYIAAHRYILVRYHMHQSGDDRMNLPADIHALPCFQLVPFQELFAVLRQSPFLSLSRFPVLLRPFHRLQCSARLLRFRRLERRDDEVLVNLIQIDVLFQFLRHTHPY